MVSEARPVGTLVSVRFGFGGLIPLEEATEIASLDSIRTRQFSTVLGIPERVTL